MEQTLFWVLKEGVVPEMLGLIPAFLSLDDPRPAREQFDAKYGHGGGWMPIPGFSMEKDGSLTYPGDSALEVLAFCWFRDEMVRFYDYSWVSVTQPDGSFEVCRMD